MNARSRKTQKTDVLIIGGGPLGWASGRLLARRKIRATIIDPLHTQPQSHWTHRGLGVFWPSLNDPPTRAVVAHGVEMAHWLQEFCKHGQELLPEFFSASEFQKIRALRAGILPHEIEELNTACKLNLGLKKSDENTLVRFFEEVSAAFLLTTHHVQLFSQDEEKYLSFRTGQVTHIQDSKDDCVCTLDTGEVLRSEMMILANGFKISTLEPWLKHMLIPMSDVQTLWTTNLGCSADAKPFAIRASSGHVASVFVPQKTSKHATSWSLRLTGPRFMLPSAGAGLDLGENLVDENLIQRIEQWLLGHFLPALSGILETTQQTDIKLRLEQATFATDCLPCDELPMLGELGLQGRILASTGWLGCGWSASLQSAAILCDLIEHGRSDKLAPLLRPRRWRNGMGEDGVTGMT